VSSKRGKKRRTGERNNIAEICATTVLDGLQFARRPFQLPPRMASLLVVVEATLQDADSKQRPDPGCWSFCRSARMALGVFLRA